MQAFAQALLWGLQAKMERLWLGWSCKYKWSFQGRYHEEGVFEQRPKEERKQSFSNWEGRIPGRGDNGKGKGPTVWLEWKV